MLQSLIIQFERCGWGRDSGPPPSLMLGFLRIWRLHGSLVARMRTYEEALKAASEKLRRQVVQIAPEDAHTMGDRVVEDAPSRMTKGGCG